MSRGVPNSTALPSAIKIRDILPDLGDGIWFMVFIASMIRIVSPSATVAPTETKAGEPGSACKYTVPTMGDETTPG